MSLVSEQIAKGLRYQCRERVFVAEKGGNANQQLPEQRLDLTGIRQQHSAIGWHAAQMQHMHLSADTPNQCAGLVMLKIVAGMLLQYPRLHPLCNGQDPSGHFHHTLAGACNSPAAPCRY